MPLEMDITWNHGIIMSAFNFSISRPLGMLRRSSKTKDASPAHFLEPFAASFQQFANPCGYDY